MSIAEKLQTIAENEQKVYEAGKKAEYDAFWDNFQSLEGYMPYHFAGAGWNDINFKPKKNIKPVGSTIALFRLTRVQNLKKCLEDCGVILDLSQAQDLTYAFAYSKGLRILPKLDFSPATNLQSTFAESKYIESIEEIVVSTTTKFHNSTFSNCSALTHLIMTGELASTVNLQWQKLLDKASITSIMDCRSSTTASGLTLTLSLEAVNKAFETSEGANDGSNSAEWTALKATRSNWTVSLIEEG